MELISKAIEHIKKINRLVAFRCCFCLGLFLHLLFAMKSHVSFFILRQELYHPIPLLELIGLSSPSVFLFVAFGLLLMLFLLLSSVGWQTRFCLFASTICFLIYFGIFLSLRKFPTDTYVSHQHNLAAFILLILFFSPKTGLDNFFSTKSNTSCDDKTRLLLIKSLLCLVYLGAGIAKLNTGGLAWMNGETLQTILVSRAVLSERFFGLLLASNLLLCKVLSIFTVLFELTFSIILFAPKWTKIFVALGVFFHMVNLIVLDLDFISYFALGYLVFLFEANRPMSLIDIFTKNQSLKNQTSALNKANSNA